MQGDLISRSALIGIIEKYKFGGISNDTEREVIKENVLAFIKEQPTGYDVAAVVESIERLPQKSFLDVAHIPRTATLNLIKRAGKTELCKTNADYIRAMSDVELAGLLSRFALSEEQSREDVLKWLQLKQEVQDERICK